ncbi:hypothetical protein AB0953_15985 [Streptomyces sp. NPDC046866]|uniref:SRPBCC family protein n=1 Tax=Streptomyces sp. NPDC046866 TaxID=3154921 RepID=UPI003452F01A
MAQWFGPAALEPHGLDFVVVRRSGGSRRTAVWTYERVPGRRLVLTWSAPGPPGGQVQLGFVFNEPLPVPAEPVEVAGGEPVPAGRGPVRRGAAGGGLAAGGA